jgi:hypothetical protein
VRKPFSHIFALAFFLTVSPICLAWFDSQKLNNVAYFLYQSQIERFDFATETYLPSIGLNFSDDPFLNDFAVDANHYYIASTNNGGAIYKLRHDGSEQTVLYSSSFRILEIEVSDNFIFIISNGFLNGSEIHRLSSINKETGILIDSEDFFEGAEGLSVSTNLGKAFLSTNDRDVSADLMEVQVDIDGFLSPVTRSVQVPGSVRIERKTYFYNSDQYIVDDLGNIFSTTDLTYVGGLGGRTQSVEFTDESIISVWDRSIKRFDRNYVFQDKFDLESFNTKYLLYSYGDAVFLFFNGNREAPDVDKLDLTLFSFPEPSEIIDPNDLSFYVTDAYKNSFNENTIYLLNRFYENIFIRSLDSSSYLTSIPLIDEPQNMALDYDNNIIYVSYMGGLITKIELNGTRQETSLVNARNTPCGMLAVNGFLLICDEYRELKVFSSDGILVDQITSPITNLRNMYWSKGSNKLYLIGFEIDPNQPNVDQSLIYSLVINDDGNFGQSRTMSSVFEEQPSSYAFSVSPNDDFIVVETGLVMNSQDYSLFKRLEGGLKNMAWNQSNLATLKVSGAETKFEYWDSDFSLLHEVIIPGYPLEIFKRNDSNSFEVFTLNDGPSFTTIVISDLDNDGKLDAYDAFPNDPLEYLDTDGDGIGNNRDTDDDGDFVLDVEDVFPLDPTESIDTDGDGIGNNADSNDDNDLYADANDSFPLDPSEWFDSDSDGVGDNSDAFHLDPTEWIDTDFDGIGDNADRDDDNDLQDDLVENRAPNQGDGNNDGILDSKQINVTSFLDSKENFITIESLYILQAVSHSEIDPRLDISPPGNFTYPNGFIEFLTIVPVGGEDNIIITLHNNIIPDSYLYFGFESSSDDSPSFFEIPFDGSRGARIDGNKIYLRITDGEIGDADFLTDGFVWGLYGAPVNRNASTSGGGGGGALNYWMLFFLFSIGFFRLQRSIYS